MPVSPRLKNDSAATFSHESRFVTTIEIRQIDIPQDKRLIKKVLYSYPYMFIIM